MDQNGFHIKYFDLLCFFKETESLLGLQGFNNKVLKDLVVFLELRKRL